MQKPKKKPKSPLSVAMIKALEHVCNANQAIVLLLDFSWYVCAWTSHTVERKTELLLMVVPLCGLTGKDRVSDWCP